MCFICEFCDDFVRIFIRYIHIYSVVVVVLCTKRKCSADSVTTSAATAATVAAATNGVYRFVENRPNMVIRLQEKQNK